MPKWDVWHEDGLLAAQSLEDNSVDMVLTDPPYYKVKGVAWDNQWSTPAEFLAWLDMHLEEWARILKPNGSLYCFASPQMAARVEVLIGGRFEVLNRITWSKAVGWSIKAKKEGLRAFFPTSEAVIFAEHFGADSNAKGESGYQTECDDLRGFVFEPLRVYLDGERKRAGIDKGDCNAACGFSRSPGGMASRHYFSPSQWCLPTGEHYASLRELFNHDGGDYLTREYEDLRRDYENLRRPFAVTPDVPYTDVWDFRTVQHYPGKHPCEKPLDMIRHMVTASTRPGALMFDPFMGSGTTGVACVHEGRDFLGCDLDPDHVWTACERIQHAEENPDA